MRTLLLLFTILYFQSCEKESFSPYPSDIYRGTATATATLDGVSGGLAGAEFYLVF